jgi:hypothetical protein
MVIAVLIIAALKQLFVALNFPVGLQRKCL